jgi:hypothetical protein
MTLEIRTEDIRQEPSANTTPDQFKVIDDVKDEPTLKEAQDFVGGIVEGIQFPNGDYMIINEEGKLINLPLNVEATALWRATFTKDKYLFGYDDYVCGPVIYIKKKALKRGHSPNERRPNGRRASRLRRCAPSIEVPSHFQNPNLLLV